MIGPVSGGITFAARKAPMIHSPGRLSLLRGVFHDSGAVTNDFANSFRSPSVSMKHLDSRSTSAEGGASEMK
jgi:hypothetical protein